MDRIRSHRLTCPVPFSLAIPGPFPSSPHVMSDSQEPSPVEVFKSESNYLRGEIVAELGDGTDHFGKGSVQLLKHHGTYQQDDRDSRAAARAAGKSKQYIFMVRTKIPGGKLTSAQLLAELDLADQFSNRTIRITSRQGLQLHGVIKQDLRETIRRINQAELETLGACGDVNRNVMCCPAPYRNALYEEMQQFADTVAAHLAPRTRAYHQLWLEDPDSGERERIDASSNAEDVEPVYGQTYMPRKFKIGIALPHDNCIDIYTHDVGLLAVSDEDEVVGYNVLVGGGLGVTPSATKTFPALGKKLCFVSTEQALDLVTAVVKVQRDFGNRSDRKVARLKYLIANWGLDNFRAKVEEYYGAQLTEPTDEDVHGFNDHMGWDEQGDGKWFYGVNVQNGRILDRGDFRLKTALRTICRRFSPGIRLTAHQSLLLTDLAEADKPAVEEVLREHRVPLIEKVSTVRRWSMACVAWPTCGLSITEAERSLPGIIDGLEVELAKLGLSHHRFTVRMTGCPNGCARPYNADVGLVGKAKGRYTLFLGGRLLGNRLSFVYKDHVPESEVVTELVPIFHYFKQHRQEDETFGDFCHRKGRDELLSWSADYRSHGD